MAKLEISKKIPEEHNCSSRASARTIQPIVTAFSNRISCSIQALGIGWFVSGFVFVTVTKGPNLVIAWCIWGSVFFVLGWALVALPLIFLGDKVRRVPAMLIVVAGGMGGALVMALPAVVLGFYITPGVHWKYSISDLRWEGMAFVIAALTTALYQIFLSRISTKDQSGNCC